MPGFAPDQSAVARPTFQANRQGDLPVRGEKEAGQQYEEITQAQQRLRKQGKGEQIRSTKKSKQRDRQEIRDEAEEALHNPR
jgi:hypothetical protein